MAPAEKEGSDGRQRVGGSLAPTHHTWSGRSILAPIKMTAAPKGGNYGRGQDWFGFSVGGLRPDRTPNQLT